MFELILRVTGLREFFVDVLENVFRRLLGAAHGEVFAVLGFLDLQAGRHNERKVPAQLRKDQGRSAKVEQEFCDHSDDVFDAGYQQALTLRALNQNWHRAWRDYRVAWRDYRVA